MSYLRSVFFPDVLDHAEIVEWRSAVPTLKNWPNNASWKLVTPVRDESVNIENSYFFKSIKSDCDDVKKKASLLNMASSIRASVVLDNYKIGFSGGNVYVKEADSFKYKNINEKIMEFKHQNKNRLYFYEYKKEKLILLLKFYHKKDQKTPDEVKKYCEPVIKSFIDSRG